MKKVVFSEGKNDVEFLRLVHKIERIPDSYDIFLTEEDDESQTKRLRQYLVDDRFDIMYKSEGGVTRLIKKFKSHSLMFENFSLYLLVDLDGNGFSDFFTDLNDALTEDYGGKVQVSKSGQTTNTDMIICNCDIEINNSQNRPLPIMAFHNSLEAATGLKYSEPRSTKIRKMKAYLENNPTILTDIVSTIH
ncbi:hypothetical protein RBH20_09210 [Haloarcula sp. H-GB4]|uniref:hypothetical protein n=1 Tax=Haloarcula sp. H-GB4 TaxID=3069755 RepID=UPI0027AE95A1|nr:hypothetical protein [Haloarcula sp. H-GB4]MDQ2072712.1 hypothetical protein [Haloarcula sp. H-GB4]